MSSFDDCDSTFEIRHKNGICDSDCRRANHCEGHVECSRCGKIVCGGEVDEDGNCEECHEYAETHTCVDCGEVIENGELNSDGQCDGCAPYHNWTEFEFELADGRTVRGSLGCQEDWGEIETEHRPNGHCQWGNAVDGYTDILIARALIGDDWEGIGDSLIVDRIAETICWWSDSE